MADTADDPAFPIMPAPTHTPPLHLPEYQPARQFGDALDSEALRERIVAVTGATGGLGTSLCKGLAQRGATVVMLGRKMKKLEALYDVLDQQGAATPAMAELDLASHDSEDARAVAEMLYAEFGRLDALVTGTTPVPCVHRCDDACLPVSTQLSHQILLNVLILCCT